MPSGQPFTNLCRSLAASRHAARVDLHLHTTCSDGRYTPAQVVELARRSGLPALAITDHDTLAGIAPARAVSGTSLEVIAGVEISTVFEGRELHLLAYFIERHDGPLAQALEHLRKRRRERFFAMVERLRSLGVSVDDCRLAQLSDVEAVGRRHLAQLLVDTKRAATVREAFQRFLGDHGSVNVPKERLDVRQAIALVQAEGGVAAWAHPGADCTEASLRDLYNCGMRAVEVEWPSAKPRRSRELRDWARALGMAVTGGSDCHGPDEPRRCVGACGISADELDLLRSHVA